MRQGLCNGTVFVRLSEALLDAGTSQGERLQYKSRTMQASSKLSQENTVAWNASFTDKP